MDGELVLLVMRIAHILRKYNPAEWGGTETAIKRLLDGLQEHQVQPVVYAPRCGANTGSDPLRQAGYDVRVYRACVPVLGISNAQRRQLVAVGGNLFSFDLMWQLRREPKLSVIHTHALNRLGGIAGSIAKFRRIPFVVTIHGGYLDLPPAVKNEIIAPLQGGWEWGKLFGWLVRSRRVLEDADAIITCNRTEATLLKEKFPGKIVFVQPHGVHFKTFQQDQRAKAWEAFPAARDKSLVLVAGRIDKVKNQGWILQQWSRAIQKNPKAHLVIAGACTDEAYGKLLKKEIRNLGLDGDVTLTGGLAPSDPRLIGLFQEAAFIVLPSKSETFGLVILEGWAAGKPVLASRTSGALELIREGQDGWLFDLENPEQFHSLLQTALSQPDKCRQLGEEGARRVREEFDATVLAGRIKFLYEELIGEP